MVQALATNNTANIQRTELFVIATTLLGAGASVNSDTRRGRGYNSVQVLARANAAATGRIRIFQSVDGGTTWILTDEEASQVDAVSGESVVFISAAIFGEDVRVQFTNTSGGTQTAFDIQAYLIPHGGAGGGGGGGGGGFAADTRNADADADFAEALIGMLTNSRLGAVDNIGTGDYRRLEASLLNAIPGTTVASIVGLEVASHLFGSDSTAAAVARAVEARNADADTDFFQNLIGILTNSRIAGYSVTNGDYSIISASTTAQVATGPTATSRTGLHTMSTVVGIDNTGAAVIRAVEARNFDAVGDVAATLIGLLTNARMSFFNERTGDWTMARGYDEPADGEHQSLYTINTFESAFALAVRGQRFFVTHQTPGTLTTAQAAFVATTPTVLLYNSAGNTSFLALRTVEINILEATAAPVLVTVAIDSADRFSAGGTAVTPQNSFEASATAYPGTAATYNATATAAGAGTRYLLTTVIPAGIGQRVTINFRDAALVNGVGSILVYVYDSAGANAPDTIPNIELGAF